MPAVAAPSAPSPTHLAINQTLLSSVCGSVEKALRMCDLTADCVGASRVPRKESGTVTGMIGVHGSVSGFITVNVSERFALKAVARIMQEEAAAELTSNTVDGIGELTNMIAGGAKAALAGGDWAFSHITVPSVIVGEGYSIAFASGLDFLTVTFEHEDDDAVLLEDRLIHVSMSLLRR